MGVVNNWSEGLNSGCSGGSEQVGGGGGGTGGGVMLIVNMLKCVGLQGVGVEQVEFAYMDTLLKNILNQLQFGLDLFTRPMFAHRHFMFKHVLIAT